MRIEKKEIKGIEVIDVCDEKDNLILRVAPKHGTKVMQLNFIHENERNPVIWPVALDEIEESYIYGKNDILFPFPNRLEDGTYQYLGSTYQFPINEEKNNNTIHGFLRERSFDLLGSNWGEETAELLFGYTFEGEACFPFPFKITILYTVGTQSFNVSFSITNTGTTAMPFGLGWHPYLMCSEESEVKLPPSKVHLVNQRYLPNGATQSLDDEVFNPNHIFFDATLELNDGELPFYELVNSKNSILIRASKEFGFLQLYTPPGKSTVAIEPMTCGVNSFNTEQGLVHLQPNALFEADIEIALKN